MYHHKPHPSSRWLGKSRLSDNPVIRIHTNVSVAVYWYLKGLIWEPEPERERGLWTLQETEGQKSGGLAVSSAAVHKHSATTTHLGSYESARLDGRSVRFICLRTRSKKRLFVQRGSFNIVATKTLFLAILLPLILVRIMILFFNRETLQ